MLVNTSCTLLAHRRESRELTVGRDGKAGAVRTVSSFQSWKLIVLVLELVELRWRAIETGTIINTQSAHQC